MNMKCWFYDLMKENQNRSNLCMENKCIENLRRCTFSDYATNLHGLCTCVIAPIIDEYVCHNLD